MADCKYGDPLCPCQDGDMCHYEGPNPMVQPIKEAKVINLSDYRQDPHVTGTARCLSCKHEWVAVAPAITEWLECPECGMMKGKHVFPYSRTDESHWTCGCGNDLFHITPDKTYCPNCGDVQNGF